MKSYNWGECAEKVQSTGSACILGLCCTSGLAFLGVHQRLILQVTTGLIKKKKKKPLTTTGQTHKQKQQQKDKPNTKGKLTSETLEKKE